MNHSKDTCTVQPTHMYISTGDNHPAKGWSPALGEQYCCTDTHDCTRHWELKNNNEKITMKKITIKKNQKKISKKY